MQFKFSFLLLFVLFACNPEEKLKKEIAGKWVISEAFRDDNVTDMLQNAYIQFETNNIMTTNILGNDSESKYTITAENITQTDPPNIVFHIIEKSSNKLVLSSEFEGFSFKFVLAKSQ